MWYVSTTGMDTTNCHTPSNTCKTIQWAIDNALFGDTIRIADGVYVERLVFGAVDITVEGNGPDTI